MNQTRQGQPQPLICESFLTLMMPILSCSIVDLPLRLPENLPLEALFNFASPASSTTDGSPLIFSLPIFVGNCD